ncbi:MAG: VCBS repeat-containing protein [Acidobacteria bacterium]|nr:VCBS repeat-containing protein [Acidobacteriota bacterium]
MSSRPRSAALMLSCALSCSVSFAQLAFNPHQAAPLPSGSGIVAVGDFNGDGRQDVQATVYDPPTTTYVWELFLSTADGAYDAPKRLPAFIQEVGDFNQDGKLDFVTTQYGSNPISVFLGNGDGTFQAAKSFTGPGANIQSLFAADINHDNKTDLVELLPGAANGNLNSTLQVWIGNGDGTFTKGQSILTSIGPVANQQAGYGLVGDFDGDGKPDMALVYGSVNDNSHSVSVPSTVQVWYGDGAGHFGSPSYLADPNKNFDSVPFVADLNNDGRSDIVSVTTAEPTSTIELYLGNANRTLSYKSLTTSQCISLFTAADYNGDGLNDLAYTASPCSGATQQTSVIVRLGTGSGNFGAEQNVYQNQYQLHGLYTARTTTATKPDILFAQFNGTTQDSLEVLTNDSAGNFPGCWLSGKAEGVTVCTPSTVATSPVKFSIGAAGPTPMRTVAVWSDGKKIAEQLTHAFSNYSFLDSYVALAAGKHSITVNGIGWDGTHQTRSFTLTVSNSNNCAAPSSTGINVCSPTQSASLSSPVEVNAKATVSGGVYRFELWSGSTKLVSVANSGTMNQSVSLAAGTYHLIFVARNAAGTKVTAARDITVQ